MQKHIEEYFNKDAIHYSLLSKLSWGYDYFVEYNKQLENKDNIDIGIKVGMLMGGITDLMITTPKEFDNTYHVTVLVRPTESTLKLADTYLSRIKAGHIDFDLVIAMREIPEQYIKDILNIIEELGLWSNTKDEEKIIKKFHTQEFWKYILNQLIAQKKVLITLEEYNQSVNLTDLIKNHTFTKQYFDRSRYEIIYQFPIYWKDEDGFENKCLLDMVIFDHKDKIIYPIDIKTMSDSVLKFMSNYKRFRYDIQGSYYFDGLGQYIQNTIHKDYKVKEFRFIVGSFQSNYPLVYIMSNADYRLGKYGNTEKKGYLKLIEEYKWYIKNGFQYPYGIPESNGHITIESEV